MGTITINGKCISISDGHSISIINGDVFVDGRRQTESTSLKQVNIVIEGNCEALSVDSCDSVEVKGDVRGELKVGGSVTVHGSVHSSVKASGSVKCGGDIVGNVNACGNVTCKSIDGNVNCQQVRFS